MSILETRIANLEADNSGGLVVVALFENESEETALAHAGVAPTPGDMVVYIRRFMPRPPPGRLLLDACQA